MTYTSHGHHIDGTVLDGDHYRPRMARCGGPGLCGKCSAEAARALNKQRELAAATVSQSWRTKSIGVDALYWDGEEESATKIAIWLDKYAVKAKIVDEDFVVFAPDKIFRMRPESWLVFHGGTHFSIHTDTDFRNLYEMDD